METWVALLRGVNVNGITIRSADLRALFESLGFSDVRTVLASGNVVFGASGSRESLKTTIEGALRDRFGYDAWIVLVPHDEMAAIVDGYPFPADDDRHAYVVFTSEPGVVEDLLTDRVVDDAPDWLQAGDGVVYWGCAKGSSTDTPFAKRAAAARFKRTTTTRNTNTLRKLL